MADILATITSGVTQTLAGSIKRITVETEWLPPIDIDDPLAPAPPGEGSAALKTLKPKITIYLANTERPVVIAPYGQPTQNWPLVKNAAIGLAIFYIGLKVFGAQRRRHRRAHAEAMAPVSGFTPGRRRRARADYTTW